VEKRRRLDSEDIASTLTTDAADESRTGVTHMELCIIAAIVAFVGFHD